MPTKRNPKPKTGKPMPKKKTQTIKMQKASVASRLLEISLKVDDYVYKDVPISARNAALFLKKVNGYKDKCLGDKRSLQVIEKLERCMKGIIEEQQELKGCDGETSKRCKNSSNHDTGSQANIIIHKPNTSNGDNVYNKDVENDLSWIENLRYVREINVEEKIPVWYEDNFWESYTLPNGWNDDEMFHLLD